MPSRQCAHNTSAQAIGRPAKEDAVADSVPPVCPRCGQIDAVQKVSQVVAGGTSTAQYGLGPLSRPSTIVSSTELAEQLRFRDPDPKSLRKGAFGLGGLAIGVFGLPACIALALGD